MEKAKRIPYGVSDFVDIIERNQYYVDKTMYLPMIEDEADSLFFIRPRRFGKSLLISMMRAYYDQRMAPRFNELFGSLWIGSHPTPEQGKYQVLYFDFSRIGGTIDNLEQRFNEYCGMCIDYFIEKYRDCYSQETIDKVKSLDYVSGWKRWNEKTVWFLQAIIYIWKSKKVNALADWKGRYVCRSAN